MEKLKQLQNEIAQKEKERAEKELAENRHKEVVKGVEELHKGIGELKKDTYDVNVKNQPKFPDEIKVNNLGDISIPTEVKVKNLGEIQIPTPPKEVSVKKPNWFSFAGVLKEIKELRQGVLKAVGDIDILKFTKKQNAIAVRLVTEDGAKYYNAGGGGGSQGGFSNQDSKNLEAIRTNTGLSVNNLDDVTVENSHTGNSELRVFQENHICLQNTTTTLLAGGAVFTGEWQDCLNYQEVNVSIVASHNSATNGLVIQWSSDGVNVGDTDTFSYYASQGGTNYTPNPSFRYVRIVYTNGDTQQTSFSLMTILRRGATGGSFHRIDSTLKDDQDARLQLSVPKLKTAANTYVSQQATTAGNAKVSIEEFDAGVSTDTNKMNVAPYLTDENGVQKQMLADTYFDGAPVTIESEHHEIHCGDSISLTDAVDLGNGAVRDILIVIPNPAIVEKRYHFYIDVISETETDYKLYETTTTSNNGTAINAFNRNRQDPIVAENEVLFYHTPTITGTGTLIETEHWGSGKLTGGSARGQNEWVFKNNTKYLVRVTNATANNNYITIKINYYVHPGV